MNFDTSVFYHPIPVRSLHALMRGEPLKPIPTRCPAPELMIGGSLIHYNLYGRPTAFPLAVKDSLDFDTPNLSSKTLVSNPESHVLSEVEGMEYLKLNFIESAKTRVSKNSFTLQLLSKEERNPFLKDGQLPKGASLVFSMPEAWKEGRNTSLTGGNIVLATAGLVTLFHGNLMQVLNPAGSKMKCNTLKCFVKSKAQKGIADGRIQTIKI